MIRIALDVDLTSGIAHFVENRLDHGRHRIMEPHQNIDPFGIADQIPPEKSIFVPSVPAVSAPEEKPIAYPVELGGKIPVRGARERNDLDIGSEHTPQILRNAGYVLSDVFAFHIEKTQGQVRHKLLLLKKEAVGDNRIEISGDTAAQTIQIIDIKQPQHPDKQREQLPADPVFVTIGIGYDENLHDVEREDQTESVLSRRNHDVGDQGRNEHDVEVEDIASIGPRSRGGQQAHHRQRQRIADDEIRVERGPVRPVGGIGGQRVADRTAVSCDGIHSQDEQSDHLVEHLGQSDQESRNHAGPDHGRPETNVFQPQKWQCDYTAVMKQDSNQQK